MNIKTRIITFKEKNSITIMNIIMIIFSLKILYDILKKGFYYLDAYDDVWPLSELLINYQGGFVRRGLLGELIYHISVHFNINPSWLVGLICLLCFVFVAYTFFHLFRINDIKWWILPLSIFLANSNIIRKDFLFATSLIIILFFYRKYFSIWLRLIILNAIVCFTTLCHEAFFFYCVPLLSMLIIYDKKDIPSLFARLAACTPMYIAMLFACVYHGDLSIAQKIQNSWVDIIPGWTADIPYSNADNIYNSSIGALAWTTDFAIKYHLKINFLYTSLRIPGYIIRPLAIILVFYFVVNYLRFFASKEVSSRISSFFCIFFFQFLSLLPLFTILSCDTMRICFYWLTSSFAFFLILPPEKTRVLFPSFYYNPVLKIQLLGEKILHPNKAITFALIFFMCAPFGGNNILNAITTSVIMEYVRIFIDFLSIL